MRILILSDIHIGLSARCKTLVPPEDRDKSTSIDDDYLPHLARFLESLKKAGKDIDYVLISGDISDGGTFEQFAHFNEVIASVLKMAGISEERLFFTTGNHDTYWATLGEGPIAGMNPARFKNRYAPLESSEILKKRLDDATGTLLEPPYYCVWDDENIIVISLNTSSHDGPGTHHHGLISAETLQSMREYLTSSKFKDDSRVKILLMHHHPINYENISPRWKDFSIIQCHEDMLDLAREFGIDLVVHGHRHQPKFQTDLNDKGQQLAIVCSGSFSHNFPSYVYDSLSNQVHVLEIDDRDPKYGILRGRILNYSFSHKNGWQPSVKAYGGIEPRISFGPNEHRKDLVGLAQVFIRDAVESCGQCVLVNMIEQLPQFQYKNEELVLGVVQQVCSSFDYEIFGTSLERSVVLRRSV